MIQHLIYGEPVATCEIHVGTFYFTDPEGQACQGEFFVRTCDEANQSKQVDDYNEQYTDEFSKLSVQGCKNIRYVELTPSPIF
jgi:hypothetical protein